MPTPNIPLRTHHQVRSELDAVSKSFCLAKWLQVTLHLQNGQTHSCHHPPTHKVPLTELAADPSALHNTSRKKETRRQMLEGERPAECSYCWEIEDAHPDNLSDRTIKSAQSWAQPRFAEVRDLPWETPITPAYLEVSFGNECNFRCAYCAPHISSALMRELKEHGPYSAQPFFSVDELKARELYPLPREEHNPYTEAFWNWWPELRQKLRVFRITGGEPLLNANTFTLLRELAESPAPELTLAVNSNLCVPAATFREFLNSVKGLVQEGKIKDFQFFVSVDTKGKPAEFIRFGLDYAELMRNARTYLDEVPECELIFMSTYNAFSVLGFRGFLEEVAELKYRHLDAAGRTRVTLDVPYLQEPVFLSCYVLTEDFLEVMREDLAFMRRSAWRNGVEVFYQSEIAKFERILTWLEGVQDSWHRTGARRELAQFVKEYCARKKIFAEDYIPEYREFLALCEAP